MARSEALAGDQTDDRPRGSRRSGKLRARSNVSGSGATCPTSTAPTNYSMTALGAQLPCFQPLGSRISMPNASATTPWRIVTAIDTARMPNRAPAIDATTSFALMRGPFAGVTKLTRRVELRHGTRGTVRPILGKQMVEESVPRRVANRNIMCLNELPWAGGKMGLRGKQ